MRRRANTLVEQACASRCIAAVMSAIFSGRPVEFARTQGFIGESERNGNSDKASASVGAAFVLELTLVAPLVGREHAGIYSPPIIIRQLVYGYAAHPAEPEIQRRKHEPYRTDHQRMCSPIKDSF